MEKEVRFNKGGNSVLIKPKTVTYIADNLGITPQDLLNCYGNRISIMSRKLVETVIQEEATKCPEPKREPEVKEPQVPQVPQPTKEIKVEAPQVPQPTKEPEVKKQPAKSAVKSAVKKASGKTGAKKAVKTRSNK